jgi:hypothetical protein
LFYFFKRVEEIKAGLKKIDEGGGGDGSNIDLTDDGDNVTNTNIEKSKKKSNKPISKRDYGDEFDEDDEEEDENKYEDDENDDGELIDEKTDNFFNDYVEDYLVGCYLYLLNYFFLLLF